MIIIVSSRIAHIQCCVLHTYPWPLDLFIHVLFQLPFSEHTALAAIPGKELIAHIAISVLPGTNLHRV